MKHKGHLEKARVYVVRPEGRRRPQTTTHCPHSTITVADSNDYDDSNNNNSNNYIDDNILQHDNNARKKESASDHYCYYIYYLYDDQ